MASTINATGSGIVLTGSTSAALNLLVGGSAALSIGTGATLTISNPSTFPAGSASAPAITTTGDTNTGVYFPAADQVAVTAGGTVAAAFNTNGLFFRNRIINGDMRIDQRNAGAAVTTNLAHPVDRFIAVNNTDGAFSAQQDASVPTGGGFVNSVKLTVTTADASLAATQSYGFLQRIEGTNVADLMWGSASARTVTLSFWARSSLTGTFGGSIRNADVNRSYPFSYSISVADTWEYKTVTIPGDTTGTWFSTNGTAFQLFFALGAGTDRSGTAGAWNSNNNVSTTGAVSVIGTLNATWYVTGVQLESGSVATPFERRPFGTELALCQRYYEKSYDYATAAGSAVAEGYSAMNNADQGTSVYLFNVDVFKVTKRTAANMRFWDLAGNLNRITNFTLGGLGRSDNNNSVYNYTGNVQNARMINVQAASTAGTYQWDASAEL